MPDRLAATPSLPTLGAMSLPVPDPTTALPRPLWAVPRPAGPRPSGRSRGPAPGMRIGDHERSRVCEELSQHYSLGRLDADELEDRLDRAVHARTQGDLQRLTRDLPPPPLPPAAVPAAPVVADGPSTASVVLAVLVLGTSLFICFGMILLSLFISPGWALGALVGGTVAAAGGVAIGHLWHCRGR